MREAIPGLVVLVLLPIVYVGLWIVVRQVKRRWP